MSDIVHSCTVPMLLVPISTTWALTHAELIQQHRRRRLKMTVGRDSPPLPLLSSLPSFPLPFLSPPAIPPISFPSPFPCAYRLNTARGLRERCKLPQRVRTLRTDPGRQTLWVHFQAQIGTPFSIS